jgi:hypothetical protein
MREYSTTTADTCWRDSIACLLEIPPHKVPDFVHRYEDEYMDKTREWLEDRFNKGLVYIPAKHFMETGPLKDNPAVGPSGYSIGLLSMVDDRANHALVCFDGKVVWDNGDDRSAEYDVILGYYVIYDLCPKARKASKVKISKKLKARRRSQ